MGSGMGYGAIANVVGGELQGWAANLEKENMFKVFKDEQRRQDQFRKQGGDILSGRIDTAGAANAQQELAAAEASRNKAYGDIAQVPLGFDTKYQSSYSPRADAAYLALRGNNAAKLGSYGDWMTNQAIESAMAQERLNRVIDQARGVSGLFPYRMYSAQHSQDILSEIGAAISSIGGGAANYAQYAQSPTGQYTAPGGVSPGGGYGVGTYYPQGGFSTGAGGYSAMPGYQSPYGAVPYGWNLYGGAAEGTIVPG